jgi:hypothetical protein
MHKPLLLSIAISLSVFSSCSKKNVSSNSNSAVWTFNGNTYKTTSAGYYSSGPVWFINGQDSAANGINIAFNPRPTINGTYIVRDNSMGSAFPADNCILSVYNNFTNYISTGKPGDIINVTISDGNLQATFSNITIENGTDTTTVSGTVFQLK